MMQMFAIQQFMNGLDQLYQQGRIDQVEPYLLAGLEQAGQQDKEAALVMLNDLMGYYRAVSRHEDMQRCAAQVLQLIDDLHLQDTLNHGTSLLNIATGFRAAGKYEQAEAYYHKAEKIFESTLSGPDYRLATLHNNLALLYTQTGRLEDAKGRILQALQLTEQLPDMEIEQAITYTNLGNVCFKLHQTDQATEAMKKAVLLFEKDSSRPDPHYPAALAGLGEVYFHQGKLEASQDFYEKSLRAIEQIYGKNDDWETTRQNLEMVQDLIRRRDAMAAKKMSGLALSKAYYEEVGRPMLQQKYPEYLSRIAVGLVGEGSECLGFDDAYSTDHDFGPGFCLWLTHEDYQAIGEALQTDYNALAAEWRGFPVRNSTAEGAGRVGVLEIDSFFEKFTGHTQAPAAKTLEDVLCWAQIPPEMLCTAVNGEVFEDKLGEFTRRRALFAEYPEPVRLYRLAEALHKMAQAGQYNYPRGRNRGDIGMMYSSLAEFIQAAAETGYLLNRSYMPFYKWRIRGMERFTCVQDLKALLEQLMRQNADSPNTEDIIEKICHSILKELQAQNLTDTDESFLDQQKETVLRRMQQLLFCLEEQPLPEISASKQELVNKIVLAEWAQFQRVHNEGGRASCQDDFATFQIMRKSQFYPWNEPVLLSYLGDLQEGEDLGWNLIMEKYARMMSHTAPQLYKGFENQIPPLSAQRTRLQEQLISIMMAWTDEMQQQYPALALTGRSRTSAEDSEWNTSSETYLRGELSTYSDATLKLYGQMILNSLRRQENLVKQTLRYMVRFYGYHSLKEADEACKKQALR